MTIKQFTLSILMLCAFQSIKAQHDLKILVFSKTEGFRHKSIPAGINFLTEMSEKNNWNIEFSEDASVFNNTELPTFDVVVFLNTTGNIFNEENKAALRNFFARGKGFVGVHSASNTEEEWPWFTEMIGATFKDHPKVQSATVNVNTSCQHLAIKNWNEKEVFIDEWYNYKNPVAKHVNVLTLVDEESYQGNKMNTKNHPNSWYHIYDGGRVFYTAMGHTDEMYKDMRFYNHIEGGILWAAGKEEVPNLSKKWTNLLEGDPYLNWDIFMGAPHATVKDLENVDPKSDGKNAKPLGLNNDPKNVFAFKTINGEQVLHISGEIYGALTSKHEYENYHLKMQFKWGEKIWEPRLTKNRDSGILYHCTGPFTEFWNVWMQSQEFQVEQGNVGDYYGLSSVLVQIPSEKNEGEKELNYKHGAPLNQFSTLEKYPSNHCNKGFDNENPHGEWNTLELICFEGSSLHIVNGKVVMALYNSQIQNLDKNIVPLHKGKIQIQSEAAEVFYKNIEIKSIDKLPKKYNK